MGRIEGNENEGWVGGEELDACVERDRCCFVLSFGWRIGGVHSNIASGVGRDGLCGVLGLKSLLLIYVGGTGFQ